MQAVSHFAGREQGRAFRTWQLVCKCAEEERIDLLEYAFNAWHLTATKQAQRRAKSERVARRWANSNLCSAFIGWRSGIKGAAQLRAKGEMVARKWANGCLWSSLNAWRYAAHQAARLRAMGKDVSAEMDQQEHRVSFCSMEICSSRGIPP